MEQDESFSKSLRWSTLEQLQQSQQLQNYQNGWEEVANFAPHSKPTPDINEDEEDKLSKVEKLLMSKGRHTQLSGLTTKDADGDVGTTTTGVQWVVGEWTECLDVECFNWNTALKRRQVSCEYPNGTSVPLMLNNNGERFDVADQPEEEEDRVHRQCNPEEKPVEAIECYNPKCLGTWHTYAWSFCKVSQCGSTGFRTRVLQCLWYGSGRPAGHACHALPRPLVKKNCQGTPCPPEKTKPTLKSNNKSLNNHKRHNNHMSKEQKMQKPAPISKPQSDEVFLDYWELYDQDVE
ncbi:uncharacterized protein LOC110844169 isoform X2 [Folsomia candida]|nr:uncharacterized protein LOC110844169 isoform X2 [Folsomia candida]